MWTRVTLDRFQRSDPRGGLCCVAQAAAQLEAILVEYDSAHGYLGTKENFAMAFAVRATRAARSPSADAPACTLRWLCSGLALRC